MDATPDGDRPSRGATLAAVVGGFALLIVGAVLALPLPEVGVPLVLIGLRLLGRRYAWARRANAWLDERYARLKERWRGWPAPVRYGSLILLAVILVALFSLLFGH